MCLRISRAPKEYPKLKLRMGAYGGSVSVAIDVNERSNAVMRVTFLLRRAADRDRTIWGLSDARGIY